MIKLAETYIHIRTRPHIENPEALAARLDDLGRRFVREFFPEAEFSVRVEEGSIRGWLVVAGTIYIAIGQYGSFRSGIDFIVKDARTFSDRVVASLHDENHLRESDFHRIERRLGIPGRIQRLLRRIERSKSHPTSISQDEQEKIRQEISVILILLDVPEDRQLFISYVSDTDISSESHSVPKEPELKDIGKRLEIVLELLPTEDLRSEYLRLLLRQWRSAVSTGIDPVVIPFGKDVPNESVPKPSSDILRRWLRRPEDDLEEFQRRERLLEEALRKYIHPRLDKG